MFSNIDFSHDPNFNIDDLVRRVTSYAPDSDFTMIRKAFIYAEKNHKGQMRSSGEEYIIHPLNVAGTLAKLRMDPETIIAGLLHDVIEDCDVTAKDIEEEFSETISEIVVGLTKISKINFKTKEESQAENFRKMVVAMAKDLRVIIVKLADRMHNMRTLQYVSAEKQRKIAQETLDIYVPLASRLGINSVKSEMEDLCLRFLKPEIYYRLAEKVAMKKSDRDSYIKKTIDTVINKLLDYSLKAEVKGRPKHFYSIYKKMQARDVDFNQIQDILAFRIVIGNITECYKVLGVIHSSFTPIPGRFKDYIAIPKVNNYQSLHTTVIGPQSERIEIQIRTIEMDETAENGIAAHWKYKEGNDNKENKLDWVEELLEFNHTVKSNNEFMDVVKNDIDIGGIFIFTPTGDVRELKYGATPLDFAYAVHTEVGHQCVGAKINGKMTALKQTLKSGDTVEILTSKTQTPSKDWLQIVKSSRAKSKIKQWLLKIERDNYKEAGKEILEKAFRVVGISLKGAKKSGDFDKMIQGLSVANEEDLYVGLGNEKISAKLALEQLPENKEIIDSKKEELEEIDSYSKKLTKSVRNKSNKDNAVIVDGLDGVMVRMAKCCTPIPGDEIIGYITRGRGITVHTSSCQKVDAGEHGRIITVEWNGHFSFKHPVSVRAITHDKPGILSLISKSINNIGINIRSALAKSLPDRKGSFIFEIEVKDYAELIKVINCVESLEAVIDVHRV